MASFGKKKTVTEYLYSKAVVAVLLLVVLFLATAVFNRFLVERQMSERRFDAEHDKLELIQRKESLKERVDYLTGDRGIEEEIRTNFDVAKEGEKVIILVGEKSATTTREEIQETVEPWYKFW